MMPGHSASSTPVRVAVVAMKVMVSVSRDHGGSFGVFSSQRAKGKTASGQ